MAFTSDEVAYIRSQRLARVATVSPDGQPDVVPVMYDFDGFHFTIGGFNPGAARRTRNVAAGQQRVALVIDDLATVEPWAPRFLRVYGTAELVDRGATGPMLRITPTLSWSMNLDGQPLGAHRGDLTRTRTEHQPLDGAS